MAGGLSPGGRWRGGWAATPQRQPARQAQEGQQLRHGVPGDFGNPARKWPQVKRRRNSSAWCLLLVLGTLGCHPPGQPGQSLGEDSRRVLGLLTSLTSYSEDDLRRVQKLVAEGSARDRAEVEWLAESVLESGSPRLAERCMPILLAVMEFPDDAVASGRVNVYPAAEAVGWFFENTTLSVPSAPDDLMACDQRTKTSKIPRFVWPPEKTSDRHTFEDLRRECQEWYSARKGMIDFNNTKYDWLRIYYGRGIEIVRAPSSQGSHGPANPAGAGD